MSNNEILLVEDNVQNAQFVVRILESCGYTVTHFTRGIEGLRYGKLNINRLAAAILDIDLPDIQGTNIGLVLHGMRNDLPLIAFTALADRRNRLAAQKFGFKAYITKPCEGNDILHVVDTLVSGGVQTE